MKNSILTILVAGIVALAVGYFMASSKTGPAPTIISSVYDRVKQSKTLRCGYVSYAPASVKDLKTGKMTGIFVDVMEEIGKRLDLKIDWSTETTWATFVEDLKTNRFDVFCSGPWLVNHEILEGEFTDPVYYSPIRAWVEEGDMRFDGKLDAINDPAVSITGIDGSYALRLAVDSYPQAKLIDAPATADYATGLMNVATGKANVTFVESATAFDFAASNPNKVRVVPSDHPLDVRPNPIMVKSGEIGLRNAINIVLKDLQINGHVDRIINKHEKYPDSFVRVH